MKKLIILLLCVAVLGGGGYFGIKKYKDSKQEKVIVDVVPVNLMMLPSDYFDYYFDDIDGEIVASNTQRVYIDTEKLVKKVYVEEGQSVKKGDAILEYDMTKEGNFALVSMTGKSVMSLKYKTAVSSNSKESPVILRLFSGNISVDMPPASDDGEKAYFPSAYIYGMLRSGGAEDGYDSTDRLEVYSTGIPLDVSEIVITECEVGPGEGYDTVSV